jgi:hypothetical protein
MSHMLYLINHGIDCFAYIVSSKSIFHLLKTIGVFSLRTRTLNHSFLLLQKSIARYDTSSSDRFSNSLSYGLSNSLSNGLSDTNAFWVSVSIHITSSQQSSPCISILTLMKTFLALNHISQDRNSVSGERVFQRLPHMQFSLPFLSMSFFCYLTPHRTMSPVTPRPHVPGSTLEPTYPPTKKPTPHPVHQIMRELEEQSFFLFLLENFMYHYFGFSFFLTQQQSSAK